MVFIRTSIRCPAIRAGARPRAKNRRIRPAKDLLFNGYAYQVAKLGMEGDGFGEELRPTCLTSVLQNSSSRELPSCRLCSCFGTSTTRTSAPILRSLLSARQEYDPRVSHNHHRHHPIRKIFGANSLVKLRRMVGLFAFFYGVLHLTTYVWFDALSI
jgi:hypothetical protein